MTPPIPRDIAVELETPRLILHTPRAGDGAAVHEAVVESLADLRAWPTSLAWALAEPTAAASETFCRDAGAAFRKRAFFAYLAFDKQTGRFVATASLHNIDWRIPKLEIGYWCRSSLHRRGYGRECVGALIEYAFASLNARRVDAIMDEENVASRALCESVGMQVEGVLRNARITPAGELRNACVLAIVR